MSDRLTNTCGSKTLVKASEDEENIYAKCSVCGKDVTIIKAQYSKRELKEMGLV